jgi:hypothetical protein
MKVTVVLDRGFGAASHPVVAPAFWLIASPENRALAGRLHREQSCDPNSAVFSGGYASAGEAAIAIFPTVVEHHPEWTEMEFIGARLDAEVSKAFAEEGVGLTPTARGFVASAPTRT